MKKKVFAIAVIVICLSILASTSLAYYTTKGTARNVITSDAITIRIEELDANEKPYEDPKIPLVPTSEVTKRVRIENLDRDSFVRAKIDVVILKNGQPTNLNTNVVEIDGMNEKWITRDPDDGWFYYEDILTAGTKTEELMNTVSFNGLTMNNDYQGCTVEVIVIAQAVQADHNTVTGEGKTPVLEAKGWPALNSSETVTTEE